MRRVIGLVVAAALLLCWGGQPAHAHTEAQLRWEGAAIALGTIGLIAVLSDAVHAQPVAIGVGAYCPPPPPAPPPPPPRRRFWVTGHWEEVNVWVPDGCVSSARHDGGHRGGCEQSRGYGQGRRHDRDECGSGSHHARRDRGHMERRRVWRDGHYR